MQPRSNPQLPFARRSISRLLPPRRSSSRVAIRTSQPHSTRTAASLASSSAPKRPRLDYRSFYATASPAFALPLRNACDSPPRFTPSRRIQPDQPLSLSSLQAKFYPLPTEILSRSRSICSIPLLTAFIAHDSVDAQIQESTRPRRFQILQRLAIRPARLYRIALREAGPRTLSQHRQLQHETDRRRHGPTPDQTTENAQQRTDHQCPTAVRHHPRRNIPSGRTHVRSTLQSIATTAHADVSHVPTRRLHFRPPFPSSPRPAHHQPIHPAALATLPASRYPTPETPPIEFDQKSRRPLPQADSRVPDGSLFSSPSARLSPLAKLARSHDAPQSVFRSRTRIRFSTAYRQSSTYAESSR